MNDSAKARMPRPRTSPHVSPRVMGALMLELDRFRESEAMVRSWYPWADRFVMGLPLAPWQRGFKWSEEQSQRFIISAWTGIHLGTYVLTDERIKTGPGVQYEYLSNAVIEGQQRLHALELYLTDQLAVPDAAGVLTKWSELERLDRVWFGRVVFSCGVVREESEAELRNLYDLMNFGGTKHEEHERATRVQSEGD